MKETSKTMGMITNIQRFSLDDGPGIRTTVFFKGCNLNCLWCHNPECIDPNPEIQFIVDHCTGCGRCVSVCSQGAQQYPERKIDRALCLHCGLCQKKCPKDCIALIGTLYTTEQIMTHIKKDLAYYDISSGGVTFSGGEPMLQLDLLQNLLQECKKLSIHTVVDTAGNSPWEIFLRIMPDTDLFLYDLKLFDEQKHRIATGQSNRLLLDNLVKLTKSGADVIVRVPLVFGINENREELSAMAEFLAEHRIRQVQIIPYHNFGVGKYEALGKKSPLGLLALPSPERLKDVITLFTIAGLDVQLV